MTDYSDSFYRKYARRYFEVTYHFLQSVYIAASHPMLKNDTDLHARLRELVPGKRGLDVGCGAGARDVYFFWYAGYNIWGLDSVAENINLVCKFKPEIKDRVIVHDLREPLPFFDTNFDFVLCNAVIQHIDADKVYNVVFPELARVIRPNGVLQLMFKKGRGIQTVYDKDYQTFRSFLLYDEYEILDNLKQQGLALIESENNKLGGIMYFTDPKSTEHCVFYVRKKP